ncbi:MAG TPA: cation diffusion facilitator family transporter [Verrucomicrobiae bacterium]|nr:cation diffusion facilitator family transporter [Verrucomicrobiae bacterium]
MSHDHSHESHDDHDHDHDHCHGHGHGHSHSPPDNNAIFAIGVVLNLGFVIAEVVYGLAANSLALLSDAGHNLGDVFGLLIAWGAIHISKSLPTKKRTYGWRRSSILAALTNAIILLIVVGGITWEAVGRCFHPEAVAGSTVMWVAALGVVINGSCALMFMAGRKHDLNIRGAFTHMLGDAAVSVGVIIIGFAIKLTGWHWLDPAMSILIGAVIVWGTWSLLRESVNLAMDAVPAGIDLEKVEKFLAGLEGVTAVHDLHIWGMSTTENALTVHLVMPQPPASDEFLHHVSHALEEDFEIGHVTIQIEHGDKECHQAAAGVV